MTMPPVPGSLEWTAQAAQGLVPAELPETRRRPLSVIFRVDAVDTPDARRQLEEVIVTAQAMLTGLRPYPSHGLVQETQEDLRRYGVPAANRPGPPPRPWDDDPRGMGA